MRYLVFGYFDRLNLGDETFKDALRNLFPKDSLFFYNKDYQEELDNNHYDAIICGEKNLFNPSFSQLIKSILCKSKIPVFGIGMSLSPDELIENHHIYYYDHLFLREKNDLLVLQKRFGGSYVHYLPDIRFSLPSSIYQRTTTLWERSRTQKGKKIGVFLSQHLHDYKRITYTLILLFNEILKNGYEIILYCLNSSENSNEDDRVIGQYFYDILISHHPNQIFIDKRVYNIKKIFEVMNDLDYAICVNYHSHIFSTLIRLPFLSIIASREVDLYMKENSLVSYVEIKRDRQNNLESLDLGESRKKFQDLVKNGKCISEKLAQISEKNKFLWDHSQIQTLLQTRKKRHLGIPLIYQNSPQQTLERILYLARDLGYKTTESGILGTEKLKEKDIQKIAEELCFWITQDPTNKYIYGTVNNIRMYPHKISEIIQWIYTDFKKDFLQNAPKFSNEYLSHFSFQGIHRSGWQYVVDHLLSLTSPTGVLLDTYLDRTFGWSKDLMISNGIIPYTSPWVGFIHHTFDTDYSNYNSEKMSQYKEFIISLYYCKGLYVLSEYLAIWWRKKLAEIGSSNILIEVLPHATDFNCPGWSWRKFKKNRNKKLINVGAWYRNPFSIFILDLKGKYKDDVCFSLSKAALKGKKMENYFIPDSYIIRRDRSMEHCDSEITLCRGNTTNKWVLYLTLYLVEHQELLSGIDLSDTDIIFDSTKNYENDPPRRKLKNYICSLISSVEIIETLPDNDYDHLLTSNIIFLNLVSCSAANTIIEAIVRTTPILVNRLPAIEEILGCKYPLFYDNLEQISRILTWRNIKRAHQYLKTMDKSFLLIDTMLNKIKRGQIYRNLYN